MANKKLEDMDNQIEKVRKQLNDLAKENLYLTQKSLKQANCLMYY